MRLVETPDNPAPPGGVAVPVKTEDGVTLRAAYWPARVAHPRGTVLILHGRAEFIEKYFEVTGELLDRGFAVATFDWRGQGSSGRSVRDGRKGHVAHFDHFRRDVEAVSREIVDPLLPKPAFGLAHSMGGCIALIGAAEGWLPVQRLVTTTPMIALSLVKHARLVRGLVRILARLGLAGRFVPGGRAHSISTEPFEGNRLSGDPIRYARNAAIARELGQGAVGSPTIGWLVAAFEAMERLQAQDCPGRIRIPTLVVGAGDDPVCLTPAIARFARALGPGSTYLEIPGSRHEIMMESAPIREVFWKAFDAFIPGSQDTPERLVSAAQPLDDAIVQPLVPAGDDGSALRGGSAIP
ncbi:alpha/beta fold hydrolase [Enterovirga aerilata]|uniref:Alpha/beta hydrolase n=1 Tax=Enterovirga aerilata TaxID=2730920 RepID=A0A849IK44_9HYPH|nr:alpha/beta hydrolase [Enterovirga sp. DB1703]